MNIFERKKKKKKKERDEEKKVGVMYFVVVGRFGGWFGVIFFLCV